MIEQYRQQGRSALPASRYRAALAATSPGQIAGKSDASGRMTGIVLPWLRGERLIEDGALTAERWIEAIRQAGQQAAQQP